MSPYAAGATSAVWYWAYNSEDGEGTRAGQEYGSILMQHADHAQACAKHARNLRHDAIADLCAAIYQEAGHAAHRETDVPGVLSTTKKNHPG